MADTNADRYVSVRLSIAANIRAERARRHLSQKQVADGMRHLGYGNWRQQTAGAVERCDRSVQADELIALAEVLNTAPETLWRLPSSLATPESVAGQQGTQFLPDGTPASEQVRPPVPNRPRY